MFFWPKVNISRAFGPKTAKIYIENQKWLDYIQTLRVPGGQYRYYISMNLTVFIDYTAIVKFEILQGLFRLTLWETNKVRFGFSTRFLGARTKFEQANVQHILERKFSILSRWRTIFCRDHGYFVHQQTPIYSIVKYKFCTFFLCLDIYGLFSL